MQSTLSEESSYSSIFLFLYCFLYCTLNIVFKIVSLFFLFIFRSFYLIISSNSSCFLVMVMRTACRHVFLHLCIPSYIHIMLLFLYRYVLSIDYQLIIVVHFLDKHFISNIKNRNPNFSFSLGIFLCVTSESRVLSGCTESVRIERLSA